MSVNRLTEKGVEVSLDLYVTEVGGDKALKEAINFEVLRLCEEIGKQETTTSHFLSNDGSREGLLARRGAA